MRTLEKEEGRLAPGRRRKHHRLDRFLLQYYIRQFGTKALARKKLRQFVSSIRYTGIEPSEQILVLPFQEPCPELADTDVCASLFSSSIQSALLTFGVATMAAPCEIPQEFPARLLCGLSSIGRSVELRSKVHPRPPIFDILSAQHGRAIPPARDAVCEAIGHSRF